LRIAAQEILRQGRFPDTRDEILALPGIGPSTAAAIAVFAFGRRAAILDGNVKRVLARCFGVEGEKPQWELADRLLPAKGIETYTQALMDLGATVCTRTSPACARCPVAEDCVARREGRIHELPAPRKKKPLPTRKATWFVLLHQGSVMLERRPSAGIWGGLWVFPEGPSGAVRSFCRKNFAIEIARTQTMPVIEHGFTHFRLQIRPIRCSVRNMLPRAKSPGRIWIDVQEAARAAVPAPVRKLLLGLA
jgi:A/G-specific adenine glycosylase